jgi:hypothetical protein
MFDVCCRPSRFKVFQTFFLSNFTTKNDCVVFLGVNEIVCVYVKILNILLQRWLKIHIIQCDLFFSTREKTEDLLGSAVEHI